MRSRTGDPKYFDCGFHTNITGAGTTWADTEVPCDNFVGTDGAPAAYTGNALVPTVNGSGYGTVDGTSYMLKKIRVRGRVFQTTATTGATVAGQDMIVRCLLVMDTMPGGVQAQGEEVIQDIGELSENIYAFQRVAATAGKFRVLKDETFTLPVTNSATDGANTNTNVPQTASFNWKWAPKVPLKVNIKAGTTTNGHAGTINCNIFMLCYAVRAGAVATVTISGASRCYYSD